MAVANVWQEICATVAAHMVPISAATPRPYRPAEKTGNLTLRPFSIVHSIIYDEQKERATGVRVIDAETKQMTEFYTRIIFLNASTLNTTLIMLNSTSQRFPNGFANDSGVLGHFLMDHHAGGVGASGRFSGLQDKYFYGRSPSNPYIPRFRNVKDKHPDFLRGYAYEVYTWRESWSRGRWQPGFGAEYKESLRRPGAWGVFLDGYGECLPYHDNRVTLNHEKRDKWDMPTLDIDMTYRDNELKMREDIKGAAVEMLEKVGVENVSGFNNPPVPGEVIHEMGTARMGDDPKVSVLNRFNQCHAAPNVFITDGSCMNSTACQNPSLTYMALTARACDYAVNELRKMNL
jgi:choline dehydrogenase-like flavoprotein